MATTLKDRTLQLQEPLEASGVASVNFFNGRLLAGGDLQRMEQARRDYDQRLGLALGDGVAFGLEVARDPDLDQRAAPVLRVQAGLTINRRGQTLRVLQPTSVALTRRFDAAADADCGCSFAPCEPVADGSYDAGGGVYILTIAPAQKATGRAASNGLDPAKLQCQVDARLDAPQFRLVSVSPQRYADLDIGSPKFRNRLAYRCFGVDARERWVVDPWQPVSSEPGLTGALRALVGPAGIGDSEVPLALLYWTAAGLQFVDVWAVRRCLQQSGRLPLIPFGGRQPASLGQAMLMQFQAQLAELGAPTVLPATVTARSYFHYLPAAGLIPLPGEGDASDLHAGLFFRGMTRRGPAFINGARLDDLLSESLAYPPIASGEQEFVWLYRVRENQGAARALPYLVFASAHLPYRADARFDAAYWNQGNYALTR